MLRKSKWLLVPAAALAAASLMVSGCFGKTREHELQEAAAAINAAIATKDDATIRATVANYTPEAQAAAAQAAADAAAAQAAAAAAAQQQQQQTQTTTTPSAAGTPAGTTTGATPGTTSGTAQ